MNEAPLVTVDSIEPTVKPTFFVENSWQVDHGSA